jgi:CBS domain containing-hemolysin-like protein
VDSSYEELLELYMDVPYTRIPIYEDSRDHVIGILHVKDLFFYKATHKVDNFDVRSIIREPLFVYEYQKTNDLLTNMKTSSNSIAIVLDEYGVTVGLITIEDLIEEIIGDIKDEYDMAEHNNIIKLDDSHYSVDGAMKLDDLNDNLELDISSEDYDSLGGYIIELLDRIPEEGAVASDGVISCKVTKMDNKRVARVLVELLPREEASEENTQ